MDLETMADVDEALDSALRAVGNGQLGSAVLLLRCIMQHPLFVTERTAGNGAGACVHRANGILLLALLEAQLP